MRHLSLITCAVSALILVAACSGEPAPSKTQDLVVTTVFGKVEAYKNEAQPQAIRGGFKLAEQWCVRTIGEDSVCTMQPPSGSVIRISGDTTLRLAELYKDNKLAVEKTGLELVAGKLMVKARTLSGDDSFTVRTKTAVAGVRGTRFIVAYDEQAGTQVAVESGRVAVGQPITVALPASMTNAGKDVNSALEKSTEVVVTPNETLAITKKDNEVAQQAAQKIVQDKLVTVASGKPEDVKKALRTFQAEVTAAPVVARVEKKSITAQDTMLGKDFEALRSLAPVVLDDKPANGKPVAATNAKAGNDKSATNELKVDKKDKPVEPQYIPRDKETVNPEERY
mgnify:CR=1 FL=1